MCRSKKTSKLRITGLCAGNSPVTGEFPAQKAGNAENVFIWWRHHAPAMVTEAPIFVSVIEYKTFHTQSERYEIKYGLRPFQYMLLVLRVAGSNKIFLNRSNCFIGVPV